MRADADSGKLTSGDDVSVSGDTKGGCCFATTKDTVITPDPDSHASADTGDLGAVGA